MTVPFAEELQSALGGGAPLLEHLRVTGVGDLPSAYRVSDLAVASIGVAGLAAAELVESATGEFPAVTVDRELASAWFGSAVDPVGWALPSVWDPLARNYRARNGWIRLHTNAPPHRDAALAVLGTPDDPIDVRRAVGRWDAVELESAIVAAGGCAAVMHSRADWRAHPQGAAVEAEPLLDWGIGSEGQARAAWQIRPDRPLAHRLDKALHHVERDVGLQKRAAHLAQRLGDIRLRQSPAPCDPVENARKAI